MINQQQLWDEETAKQYDTPGEGMFSPQVLAPGHSGTVEVNQPGYLLVDTYDVLNQHVISHHVHFGPELLNGRQARIGRTPHRYIWPSELDLMARLAGFALESRWADWDGSEFTGDSRSHVSVYRLTGPVTACS